MKNQVKYPSYLNLYETGELAKRVKIALSLLEKCSICPHKCGVNRLKNEKGFCRTGRFAILSSYFPHHGEEFPIRGYNGSGTIFFSNCNLKCVYCQNYDISQFGNGEEITPQELANAMLTLQAQGCHNINFVTPSHVVPQILEALLIAVEKGLKIPLVYNTSSYDSVETLKLLDGIVDIYLPDFKYGDNKNGKKYSKVKNYFDIASQAIKEMHNQVGDLLTDSDGIAIRGVLVRHLVLPNNLANIEKIIEYLKSLSPNFRVNIMAQYHPCYKAYEFPELSRRITDKEYQEALKLYKG